MGCPSLLRRNFLTQGSDPGLLSRRQILYRLSHREAVIRARSGPNLLIPTNPAESVLAASCGVPPLTAPTLHQAWPPTLLRTHPPPIHGEPPPLHPPHPEHRAQCQPTAGSSDEKGLQSHLFTGVWKRGSNPWELCSPGKVTRPLRVPISLSLKQE